MPDATMNDVFSSQALQAECHIIAQWWIDHAIDNENGGFYGEINVQGESVPNAAKGIILNTRILWFFSEAAIKFNNEHYAEIADRAYDYLIAKFDDAEHSGVYWQLNALGACTNSKKQVYAHAFAIYGLSAYYMLRKHPPALMKALAYFELIEKHAIDSKYGGYLEAFAKDWTALRDVRLSTKDQNSPKTMNTHIHILEAYTCLYRATKNKRVGHALRKLINVICTKILDVKSFHLRLFMDMNWQDVSTAYSYGHDIECSWLIWDAVIALEDGTLSKQYAKTIVNMAEVCLQQSIGDLGHVCDQYTFADNKKHLESFWWVQAESLVGFLNAFQLTGDAAFYEACVKIWAFIQEQHIDEAQGEWLWSAKRDDKPGRVKDINVPVYKAGFWKGPYHNGRSMMEGSVLLREVESFMAVEK
jgi:mannobiose 2-epimerase